MRISKHVLWLTVVVSLAGCAAGTKLSETPAVSERPAPGVSRIVIYRTGVLGAAVQPEVLVDGQSTSTCQPNGVFYVDVKPGEHLVTASTEVTRSLRLSVPPSTSAYVECSIGIGLVVGRPYLKSVPADQAKSKIGDLVFKGSYSVQ